MENFENQGNFHTTLITDERVATKFTTLFHRILMFDYCFWCIVAIKGLYGYL